MKHSYTKHEILHTTYVIYDIFETHIVGHAGIGKEEKKRAKKVARELWELYQYLGENINK